MAAKWKHPKWGTFKHDGVEWQGKVEAPAFLAFTFEQNSRAQGTYSFCFESYNEADDPTPEMIAAAERVLAAQERIVGKVTKALWDEFNGRGGESGMWWRGDMDQVAEGLEDTDLAVPKKAADIVGLMRLSSICVRATVHGYDKPLVELRFDAAFEEEHGVGILTDGRKILGTGYSSDVTPYPSEAIVEKPSLKKVKGRLVSSDQAVTGWIELDVEVSKGLSQNWEWHGSFAAPPGFDMEKLPRSGGGFKYKLEIEGGKAVTVFLREQDESGKVTFLCPGGYDLP